MTNTWLIEELVTKECERYELETNGFVTNRKAVINSLLNNSNSSIPPESNTPKEFAEWKEQLLQEWYDREGFARFFRRKAEKHGMHRLVKQLLQNALSRFKGKYTSATIDNELKIENGRTVAFKLSSRFLNELYSELCRKETIFTSPGQLEAACVRQVHSLFPLPYAVLYERLSDKDNEFWEELWRLIRRFARFLVTDRQGKEEEENVKELSMETALSIQEQLERGKLRQITSAKHLLHSLQMTCRNKYHELLRSEEKKQEEILLNEEDWYQLEYKETDRINTENIEGRFDYLLDINEKNEYEVCCALADVLSYGRGQVYESLTEGIRETAHILSMLYVEDKKYEEIADILYGTTDTRKLTNLRKSVSRGKEYLKKRMGNLIVSYKSTGNVPRIMEEEE